MQFANFSIVEFSEDLRFAENGKLCKHVVDANWNRNAKVNLVGALRWLQEGNVAISKETRRIDTFFSDGAVTRRAFLSRTCNSFSVLQSRKVRGFTTSSTATEKARQQPRWTLRSRKCVGGKFLCFWSRRNVKMKLRLNELINHRDRDFLGDCWSYDELQPQKRNERAQNHFSI